MTTGTMVREWRAVRRRSQLEVAMDAGLSQRQFSFIESGRSAPKRETLLAIASALDIPLRERNELLLASGFAPVFSDAAWSDAEMRSVKSAVDRLLRAQEPYPALLMDRYWNVLSLNDAALRLFSTFIDMETRAKTHTRNLLHLMFDPTGLRPFIHDWPRFSQSLLERVRHEAIGNTIDERTQELLDSLLAYPGAIAGAPASIDGASELPMIPLSFARDGAVLNYFSMVTTVGTPRTIGAQELRVESLFPADEATEQRHLALVRGAR